MKKYQENLINKEIIQKLALSPIEKYEKFNNFPVTVFINIALAVLTVIQVNKFTSANNLNNSNQYLAWNNLIYGNIQDNNLYQYFTLKDIQAQIQSIFKNLSTQQSSLLNPYIIDGKTIAQIVFYKKFPSNNKLAQYSYDINLKNGIDKPFNMNSTQSFKEWIQIIDNFYIYIQCIGITDYLNVESQWNLQINYKVKYSYKIQSYLRVDGYQISRGPEWAIHMNQQFDQFFYINIVILILSFLSIIKLLLRIIRIIQLYMQNRYMSKKNFQSWNKLTFKQKWSFFDLSFIYSLFGHFIQLFTSICILSPYRFSYFYSWGIGLSAFFAITSMTQYFQYNQEINLIAKMIIKSAPRIIVEAFAFIPIAIAYFVLGMVLFSNSDRYSDISQSLVTSFSLLLGDSLHDITIDLISNGATQKGNSFIAIIYVWTFVFTFMITVHNIWVAIICQEFDIFTHEIYDKKKLQKQQVQLQKKLSINKNQGTVISTNNMKIDQEDLNEEELQKKQTINNNQATVISTNNMKIDQENLNEEEQNPFQKVESFNQYEIQIDEQNNQNSEYNFSDEIQPDFKEDLSFKIQQASQKLKNNQTVPFEFGNQSIKLQYAQRQQTNENESSEIENQKLKKTLSLKAINQVAKKLSIVGQSIDNNSLQYSKQNIKQIFKLEQDQIEQKTQILKQINFLTQEIKFLVDQCRQDNKDMQIYNLTKDEKQNIQKQYKGVLKLVTRYTDKLLNQIKSIL